LHDCDDRISDPYLTGVCDAGNSGCEVDRTPEVVAIPVDEWAGVHSCVCLEVGIGEHLHEVHSSSQPACGISEVEHRPIAKQLHQ
jgi:hypothetical protein